MPSLWFNGDLTAGTGAPPAAPGSRLDGYVTSNDQMHINYVDADGHVHELWYQSPNGPWLHNDLTDISQGNPPSAAPGSALAGYETSANGQQHVNYLDANGHVHELVYKEPSWQAGDLTAGTGAPPAAPGSRLDGYVTSANGQMHINYLDANGHVHELVYKEPSWQAGDLTAGAGAPPAAPGSALAGYETSFNNQQHINYLDTDGHVHELWYQSPNGPWLHNDLTDIGQGNPPPAAPGSALAGYETSFNSQMHINYLDANGHVHELVYKHSPITVTPTSIIYNRVIQGTGTLCEVYPVRRCGTIKRWPVHERIELPHLIHRTGHHVHHTTGFDREEIIDLCIRINSVQPGAGSPNWPPCLGLFKSVVAASDLHAA